MRETDLADELFGQPGGTALPAGVRVATARQGGVTITRVEISREGLARPRGRYVTLEVPSVSLLDERDSAVIEAAAAELRPLLPPEGPVLVLGVGNRRVTADALGPRAVQKVFVTMGPRTVPVQGIRPVAAVAPGVSAATGLSLQQLAGALVRELRPAALLCVDSLCSAEPERLGRTLQFSAPGLHPAQPAHSRRRPAGCACPCGGHPHPDAGRGGPGSGRHAPGSGRSHRPRCGPAGGCHQPGPAAKAECGAVVLAGGVTLSVSPSLVCSPDRGQIYAAAGCCSYWERPQCVRIDGAVLSYLFCRRG